MNVYIWKSIAQCSGNYHSDGGVVVIAETEAIARELARSENPCCLIDAAEHPDLVVAVGEHAPAVFIFPNAGCC